MCVCVCVCVSECQLHLVALGRWERNLAATTALFLIHYVLLFVKVCFFIVIEFGFFPVFSGFLVDIASVNILGGDVASRLSAIHTAPIVTCVRHWLLGVCFMAQAGQVVSLFRSVLRKKIIWFLRDPDDPDFSPLRDLAQDSLFKHSRRATLFLLLHIPTIVALFILPLEMSRCLFPSVFPIDHRSVTSLEVLASLTMINLFVPALLNTIRPVNLLQWALRLWVKHISSLLSLDNFLLPVPLVRLGPSHRPALRSEETPRHHVVPDRGGPHFGFRLTCFIVLTTAAWGVFWSLFVLAPLVSGRALLYPVRTSAMGDGAALSLGTVFLLLFLRAGMSVIEAGWSSLLRTAIEALSLVLQYLLLGSTTLVLAPTLFGILVEMAIPLRSPVDTTPIFYPLQAWCIGIGLTRLALALAEHHGRAPVWRQRLAAAQGVPWHQPATLRTLRQVTVPILYVLSLAHAVPYAVFRGLLPALGAPPVFSMLMWRLFYPALTAIAVGLMVRDRLRNALAQAHDSIRDERWDLIVCVLA
mmetsp:Transcript_21289/g.46332  ORF Transcript_21289/g.46332 Transcript_21289/m.46332 type:complete len:528 (-) Transcript_21289:238-1821(-)